MARTAARKRKKSRVLNSRQRTAVRAVVRAQIEGIPQRAVAREVYPNQSPNAASVSLSRLLNDANVQDAVIAEFDNLGMGLRDILKPIKDGLTATNPVIVKDRRTERRRPNETDAEYWQRQDDAAMVVERVN